MRHGIQAQLIKKRLVGKEGQARVKELRAIPAELPGYKNGPYADLRKWVEGELVETRSQGRTLADAIHHQIARHCTGARIWGPRRATRARGWGETTK